MNRQVKAMFLAVAFICFAALSAYAANEPERVFFGEIGDTQCALNVHSLSRSHKEMMAMRPQLKTHADCARFCVQQRGGRFVLQAGKNVYKLDNQDLAEQNAGLKVRLIGVLDPKTDIIAVRSIEPLHTQSHAAHEPK